MCFTAASRFELTPYISEGRLVQRRKQANTDMALSQKICVLISYRPLVRHSTRRTKRLGTQEVPMVVAQLALRHKERRAMERFVLCCIRSGVKGTDRLTIQKKGLACSS